MMKKLSTAHRRRWLSGLTGLLSAAACASADAAAPPPQGVPEPYGYVAFKATGESPLTIAGRLTLPAAGRRPLPAVVIVHGSAGVDGRSIDHAQALQQAGIATLEIDLWSARWPQGGPLQRPKGVPETLPDAFGALAFLAAHQAIDKTRIGILGFSWGGVVSMLTAVSAHADRFGPPGLRFAAHAPYYPVCWVYGKVPGYAFQGLTGAPIQVHAAERDDYEAPATCAELKAGLPAADQALVEIVRVPQASHAFDRRGADLVVNDPYAHFGKGGEVRMQFLPDEAAAARQRTVEFFRRQLRPLPR
jgi:dienelactone hydrolase